MSRRIKNPIELANRKIAADAKFHVAKAGGTKAEVNHAVRETLAIRKGYTTEEK